MRLLMKPVRSKPSNAMTVARRARKTVRRYAEEEDDEHENSEDSEDENSVETEETEVAEFEEVEYGESEDDQQPAKNLKRRHAEEHHAKDRKRSRYQ
jgi:predicted ATPase